MELFQRHRRLRANDSIRQMVRENQIQRSDLIYPLFFIEGEQIQKEVPSMPGVYQYSLDYLNGVIAEVVDLGIPAVMIFGVPAEKDEQGKEADQEEGIVQRAIRKIKQLYPDLYVIADTCLCQYTSHGHCGLIDEGKVANDASLERLVATAVSQAEAGADMIAPSNMMDGFVYAIRQGLNQAGYEEIPILSYAVKYASSFYGPFRDAAHSSPQFGDRRTYQMDPANAREALREVSSDIEEGADMVMVKPGISYLDIIYRVKESCDLPVVAYNVSGEYAMVKAAAQNGWIDEQKVVMEMMVSMKRAGADLILTYHAKEIAQWLQGEKA